MSAMPAGRELAIDDVRRTALVGAGAFLAFAPLHTIFSDTDWAIETFGAIICVLGPAMFLRLRRGPRALQLVPGLVLLVFFTTALYLNDSAVAGIFPGPESWRALQQLRDDAGDQIQNGTSPLPSTIALRVGVVPALGLLSALIDWAAVIRRAPALAGVPLLALFTICGAVAGTSVGWIPFAISAAGFLIILSADSRVNLLRWGRVVPRRQGDHSMRPRLGLSGRRIGVIAVMIAVILPAAIPGLSRNLLVDAFHRGTGGGGQGTSLSPFATLKGQLAQTVAISLAQVQVTGTTQPFYLKSKVLNVFTAAGWSADDEQADQPLTPDILSATADPPRLAVTKFNATITVDQLADTAAPVFGAPTGISGLGGDWRWDPIDSTVSGDRTRRGMEYRESVLQPNPSVDQLRNATAVVDQPDFSALPTDLPAVVSQTVTSIVASAATATDPSADPYDRARALTDYFLNPDNGFVYDLQTKAGDSGNDLVDFLENKSGYCQQYAGALAVMFRVSDIPSRVVLGYTHPAPDKDGRFTITNHDAHAWVEGYFAGLGWLPFDPTPLDPSRVTQLPYAPHPTQASLSAGATETGPSRALTAATKPDNQGASNSLAAGGPSSHGPIDVPGWLRVALEVLLVIVVLLLVLPGLRRLRHRTRLRAALNTGRLEPLWQELWATAVDTGAGWGAATTPRQVPAWLAGLGVSTTAGMTDFAHAVERERYARVGAQPLPRGEVNDSIDRLDVTSRALWARQRPGARLRSLLLPPSILRKGPIMRTSGSAAANGLRRWRVRRGR